MNRSFRIQEEEIVLYTAIPLEIKTSSLIKIFHSCVVVLDGRQPACVLRLAVKNFYSAPFISISSGIAVSRNIPQNAAVLYHSENIFHEAAACGEMQYHVVNSGGQDYALMFVRNDELIPKRLQNLKKGIVIYPPYSDYDEKIRISLICLYSVIVPTSLLNR